MNNMFEEKFKKQKSFYDSLPKDSTEINKSEEKDEKNDNDIKKEEIASQTKEISLPDIDYLDNILEKSEELVNLATLSEQEIDKMLEERQETRDKIRELEIDKENSLQQIELPNFVEDLTASDYERMVEEKIIDDEYAKRLEKLDNIINKLEKLDNISTVDALELKKLSQIRSSIREKLESQIQERQQEFIKRQKEIENKIFEEYAERLEKLENIMVEIESNPKVFDKLYSIAKKEKELFEKEKEESEKKVILEATRITQSLAARHNNVFERLEKIVNNKDKDEEKKIKEKLIETLKTGHKKEIQSIFDKVRSQVIKSIVEGDGEDQIKNSKEVVPWETYSTAIPYMNAINTVSSLGFKKSLQELASKDNKRAQKLLEECDQISDENLVLRKLIGKKWVQNKKTNKKQLGAFWSAFEIRKENDKKGITEKRKKEREKRIAEMEKYEKAARELEKRGGIMYKVPIKDDKNNTLFYAWTAVKIEKGVEKVDPNTRRGRRRIKNGKSLNIACWKIAEVAGAENGMKVGSVADLTMIQFPERLREVAEKYFEKEGEEFIKPISREVKE